LWACISVQHNVHSKTCMWWGKSKRHYEVEHSDNHRLFCKSSRNQSIPQCGLSHFYRACRTIWSVNNNMVWIVKIPIPDRML
jgi:hypothetical protein